MLHGHRDCSRGRREAEARILAGGGIGLGMLCAALGLRLIAAHVFDRIAA
jgi:hypothetical protein